MLQIEREKKQARQQQKLLVASQDFDDRTDMNEKNSENGTILPNNTAVTIIPANANSHIDEDANSLVVKEKIKLRM